MGFGNGQVSNDENHQFKPIHVGNYAVQYAGYNNLDTLTIIRHQVQVLNIGNNWLGEPWFGITKW